MSYYFVNNKYPLSDPNIDLNFNNDILYNHIVGDDAVIAPTPYKNAGIQPSRSRKANKGDITPKSPSYNIFLCFILFTILVVLTFYLNHSSKSSKPNRIRLTQNTNRFLTPNLVMLGPQL
jgi:hypothetical protein